MIIIIAIIIYYHYRAVYECMVCDRRTAPSPRGTGQANNVISLAGPLTRPESRMPKRGKLPWSHDWAESHAEQSDILHIFKVGQSG